jgi:hypothetical protein
LLALNQLFYFLFFFAVHVVSDTLTSHFKVVLHDFFFLIFFIGMLPTYPMGFDPMTSPSTLLQREQVPVELKLIGKVVLYEFSENSYSSLIC